MLLFETLICLAIGIMIAVAIVKAYAFVMTLTAGFAFVFSKAAISLVIAFMLNTVTPLQDNTLISYAIWAAICLGVCFLVCRLPRVDCSLDFICKVLITYFFTWSLVSTLRTTILKMDIPQAGEVLVAIGIKLVVLVMSASALIERFQKVNIKKFSNIVVVTIDRIIASVLYGFSCSIILISNLPISLPEWSTSVSLIGFTIAAFVVDCVYISKK